MLKSTLVRCAWASSPEMIAYHDREWGVPVHDDRRFFEFLTLEGAQAGLSWRTILLKRENYRKAFADFEPGAVAMFDAKREAKLLRNPGIVRNRLKIASTIRNAKAFLKVQQEFGSFNGYVWRFVGGKQIVGRRNGMRDMPAKTEISDALSKDLLSRDFKFVGSTICYAFMQATGLVNDHLITCFRFREISREKIDSKSDVS